ncbi:glycosyltransferase [Pontibacter sp. H259]|uniref:glycosyltransferase n=1 Tax=Pontibacter sp. H259 TaxID=3133421 RepID=UPI0030C11FE3
MQIDKNDEIFFISKDANWQKYRNEVLSYFSLEYNIKVTVLTTGSKQAYLKEHKLLKYKIFKNWFSSTSKFNFFPLAILYVIRNRPKCVIAQNNVSNLTEYILILACRLLNIKFLWWTHAYEHKPIRNYIKRKFKYKYVNFFLKQSKGIITYSSKGKEFLITKKFDRNKIFVANNTLDTEKLKAQREIIIRTTSREELIIKLFPNLDIKSKFIVFSGRVLENKKLHNLIKSFEYVLRKYELVNLIVIGDGSELTNCINLADELNISDSVYFMGSVYEDDKLNEYLSISDVFVIPGLVGLSIIHAFAFGIPFITERQVGHGPEIQYLKHNFNGFIVDEDNTIEMAETILSILNDDRLFSYLSNNALQTFYEDASIKNMINSIYDAVNS